MKKEELLDKKLSEFIGPVELAVLVSGTVNMGLEILAGRMLAPEYGSSVYTWGSIIGIFMASLSLGYYIGGKRSSSATKERVSRILLQTSIFITLLIFFQEAVVKLLSTLPLGPVYSPLPAVAVLFAPPAYILGLITPYAAHLSETSHEGEASGRVFALGTVGSIIGSFATTFVLIPGLSVNQVLIVLGVVTVAGAVTVDRKISIVLPGLVIVGLMFTGFTPLESPNLAGDVVYQTQTPYQQLKIVDEGGTRTMYLNGQPNSAMDLNSEEPHVFDYTEYFHIPQLLSRDIDNVVFIGGGGFTGPKHFSEKYNATVDVVEIDPEVVGAAKKYFRVNESEKLNIEVMDGRRYLENTDKEYDLIVVDAYKKDQVPFHLTTRQFYSLVYSRLDEDGVVLANTISSPKGSGSEFFRSEYKTISQVFPSVYGFRTSDFNHVQNVEIVAAKSDRKLSRGELLDRNRQREIGVELKEEVKMYIEDVKTSDVPVLQDDKAPTTKLLDSLAGENYTASLNQD